MWLTVLKWAGGAYLVWLGVQVWRSPPLSLDASGSSEPRAGWSMFQQGALSAITNPKAILFFAAFLPQFLDPHRSVFLQFSVMAVTFAAIEIATEFFIPAWPPASAPGCDASENASVRFAVGCLWRLGRRCRCGADRTFGQCKVHHLFKIEIDAML